MSRPDLANKTLIALVASTFAILIVYFAFLQERLPVEWRTPGSFLLYVFGVLGTVLLLVSMVFVLVKRTGKGGSPQVWFIAHVITSLLGSILVVVHSAGYLRRPPVLLFLALLGLAALGVWARLYANWRMAGTFGSKLGSFAPASEQTRVQLRELILRKRELLQTVDPFAVEGTFSITLAHWLKAPRFAIYYQRLVREENRLLGTRKSVGMQQAYWRPLHLALAYLFVSGILIHVVTVTFFAGYVADGGPITWWHIRAW